MSKIIGLFGCGGFGREVMPVLLRINGFSLDSGECVFVVENLKEETLINGIRVISDETFLNSNYDRKYFNVAIADSKVRERIALKMLSNGVEAYNIKSRTTITYDSNAISEGCILCDYTMVTSNAKIGRFFHANIYSYVAHDCVIGNFVTFAPKVCCNGRVIIEDHAYIGTGAVIKQGSDDKPIIIGEGAVVGMGAVVTKSVYPYTTFVGNPARELKK